MDNKHLQKAKSAKNDEFYTRYEDVEKECDCYSDYFKGKIVYCNCDIPERSKFWEYFHRNFSRLGLKKLIASGFIYDTSSYCMDYCGGDDENLLAGERHSFFSDGDFRSMDSINALKEADVVVTNPPFSLFREFMELLFYYKKDFLILGLLNVVKYGEIFSYVKEGTVRTGVHSGEMVFDVPDDFEERDVRFGIENGKKWCSIGNVIWLTNMKTDAALKHLDLKKKYDAESYPTYDNLDAIEVSKVQDIPVDYEGVMGVPISYLLHTDDEQFRIVGKSADCRLNGKRLYERILLERIQFE